jgi:hypothetical protein
MAKRKQAEKEAILTSKKNDGWSQANLNDHRPKAGGVGVRLKAV